MGLMLSGIRGQGKFMSLPIFLILPVPFCLVIGMKQERSLKDVLKFTGNIW